MDQDQFEDIDRRVKERHEKFNRNIAGLVQAARRLGNMSRAASTLGLSGLSDELYDVAMEVERIQQRIVKDDSDERQGAFDREMKSQGQLLSTMARSLDTEEQTTERGELLLVDEDSEKSV